jgi:putative FmdB family regulatory protein
VHAGDAVRLARSADTMEESTDVLLWRLNSLPLYAYRCTACGHSFEKIQSFSDEPEQVCPKCGGELVRPLTAPALQFKGAGWYVNDYAAKSSAVGESATAEKSEKKEGSTAPAGTETKKAAASESTPSAPASTPSASDKSS